MKPSTITFTIIAILLAVWAGFYITGVPSFNKINSVQIYGSIIQGMSALLGVVLAASIFRIQSLENRIQSIEQSTLDYIYKITSNTYPYWGRDLEEHIEKKIITEKYFQAQRKDRIIPSKNAIPELEKDRDDQQERLNHNLILHNSLKKSLERMRKLIPAFSLFLIIPIAYSFLLFDVYRQFI